MSERNAPRGPAQNPDRARPNQGQDQGMVDNLVEQAGEAVSRVADQASELAQRAYEQGGEYLEEGRRRFPQAERYYREGSRAVSRQVEESPLAAILVAVAIGYGLALLIHSRR